MGGRNPVKNFVRFPFMLMKTCERAHPWQLVDNSDPACQAASPWTFNGGSCDAGLFQPSSARNDMTPIGAGRAALVRVSSVG